MQLFRPCRMDLRGEIEIGDVLGVYIMEDFLISGAFMFPTPNFRRVAHILKLSAGLDVR